MEIIVDVIQTTLNSFDFAYCIVVNVLTYIIINFITAYDKINLTTWEKRTILVFVILLTSVLYYLFNKDIATIFNSAILSPVFWSWIIKPICKYFNIDYKKIDVIN